jgi:RNA polymerase sigma-70 factor (ECF subfamily)
MESQGGEGNAAVPIGGSFVTTRWSLVLAARDRDSPEGDEALESLCRQYWYPLYGFVRGMGHSAHDAQDFTQEFFSRLLAKEYLRVVDPERGRFRTFLRMAVRRFLANEWQKTQALKRGGGVPVLALDTVYAEERMQLEFGNGLPPDVAYDRRWAMELLNEAAERLEREYARATRIAHYQALKPFLTAERGSIPYDVIAERLGTDEGAARVAIHRMRKRFRKLFRDAVSDTVETAEEVELEFQYVVKVLGQVSG